MFNLDYMLKNKENMFIVYKPKFHPNFNDGLWM